MALDRVQKLKDARAEASKEVEDYKKQKEKDYKAFESKVSVTFPPVRLTYIIASSPRL